MMSAVVGRNLADAGPNEDERQENARQECNEIRQRGHEPSFPIAGLEPIRRERKSTESRCIRQRDVCNGEAVQEMSI